MSTLVHPTAIIEDGATLGRDVRVGPYSRVCSGAAIGDGCELHGNVVVFPECRLEPGVIAWPGVVVGGDPQVSGFDADIHSKVVIGAGSVLREHVTVHRSSRAGGATVVGARCLLMVGSHVAHDCRIGDGVILANAAQLGGHVEVGDNAFVGGGALAHQFVRIGTGAMVAGGAVITLDVVPFLLVSERTRVSGLNLVGLKRRGVPQETIRHLKRCFREILARPGNPAHLAVALEESGEVPLVPEVVAFLEFCRTPTKRGLGKARIWY